MPGGGDGQAKSLRQAAAVDADNCSQRQRLLLGLLARTRAVDLAGRLRAEAVELVAMAKNGEAAEPLRDLVLETFDLVVLELEDEAALHADQVIVMIADDLVARLAVTELTLDGEAGIDEE